MTHLFARPNWFMLKLIRVANLFTGLFPWLSLLFVFLFFGGGEGGVDVEKTSLIDELGSMHFRMEYGKSFSKQSLLSTNSFISQSQNQVGNLA